MSIRHHGTMTFPVQCGQIQQSLFSVTILRCSLTLVFGRAARVREYREPAPRMGRVSLVQTTTSRQIFPASVLTNPLPN
jgi:hypothetical protein